VLELDAMRSNKPFTNVNFTKRVDHEAGRHRPPRAMSEPAVCNECGAIYTNRRWSVAHETMSNRKHQRARPLRTTLCPACRQASSGEPRGFVYLDGAFLVIHRQEIENLMLNEAERARQDNPLARILEFNEGDSHKFTITTTTEHLAQRLGHALEKAFGGQIQYDFSHENKIARVSWQRE
jgi:hypothetical protein